MLLKILASYLSSMRRRVPGSNKSSNRRWQRMLAVAGVGLFMAGCGDPRPVSLIFLIDSSASFEPHRTEASNLIKSLNDRLEPRIDRVQAIRMASDVYWLFDSEKPGGKKLRDALDAYMTVTPNDSGTAYGTGLERGLREARDVAAQSAHTAVVVLGDGADERSANGSNVDWQKLPQRFAEFPASASLFFLFIEPKNGDRFREALKPVLGPRIELFTPESTTNGTAKNKILSFLER